MSIRSSFIYIYQKLPYNLVAQRVKHLLAMWETRVWSLGREGPLEKEMATHSSALAWKIPWMEKPGRLQAMGLQRVGHDWATSLSFPFLIINQKIDNLKCNKWRFICFKVLKRYKISKIHCLLGRRPGKWNKFSFLSWRNNHSSILSCRAACA